MLSYFTAIMRTCSLKTWLSRGGKQDAWHKAFFTRMDILEGLGKGGIFGR
jgi:hypothetical protein